ncbi:MAG: restriction endonuclease subunit S, partial [Bacilli bacterium]|nr:restriction endonuclease subunit S [Bacilli bacterium]
ASKQASKLSYNYDEIKLLQYVYGYVIINVSDLFEIRNGLNKEKEAFGKGTPIVNFTDVFNKRYLTINDIKGRVTLTKSEIERYAVKKGDVFFTRTSETKEEIGMSSTVIEDIPDCVFSGFVLRARPVTDLLLPKYCSYYFSTTNVRNIIIKYASFTTRATTTGEKLGEIPVVIPSIEEQQRIVDILDKFDKLCNDLTSGLPAEIEMRKKQYEYYRDKLLSFK